MKRELVDATNSELRSCIGLGIVGTVLIVGAIWFWHSLVGNPFDEPALIRSVHACDGLIVEAWEEADSGDFARTFWFHGVTYTYRLPDGREFTQHTKTKTGRMRADLGDLAQPSFIEVEYLPDDPSVIRIKGEGSPTVFDWLWRKIGLGGLLLALFLTPGITMVRNAIRDFNYYRQSLNKRRNSKG